MANTIEIKITANNSQAIAALRQLVSQAQQTASGVNAAGQNAGGGFSKAANEATNSFQKIGNEAGKAKNKISGVGSGNTFSGAQSSGEGFIGTLGRIGTAAMGIYAVFQSIKEITTLVFGSGFDFSRNMETTQLGMAGIIKSMVLMDGKAVDFNTAMALSSDIMKKLQQDALATSASTEELANAYRAILAPGVNAGMSLDQIRQLTVVGVNALKSLNVPAQQTVQELRDLVQGGITAASSTLATALGLTDKDIDEAKNSSEGLFKFLMDRMNGFTETSKKYPETMTGSIDQLKESWTLASAQIESDFNEPIKEGIQEITSLLGDMNTETGKFEVNPEIISFFNEIKSCLKDIKQFAQDITPVFGDEWNSYILPTLKSLWNIFKDLCGIISDLSLLIMNATKGFRDFALQGVRDLANDIEWLIGKIREYINLLTLSSGAKTAPSNGLADYRRSEDTNTQPPAQSVNYGEITAKYPKQDQAIKNSQAAMQASIRFIEAENKEEQKRLKALLEQLEVQKSLNQISVSDYNTQKAQLELAQKQSDVNAAQRKYDVAYNASYQDTNSRTTKLAEMQSGLDVATESLNLFQQQIEDINSVLGQINLSKSLKNSPLVQESGFQDLINRAAEMYNISPLLIAAVMKQESSFNPNAQSSAGAMGLMQLMPDTARGLGVDNPWDAAENIFGGAKYLRELLDTFGNDVSSAVAAYNAGPGAVQKYGGVPPYAETQNYVENVMASMGDQAVGIMPQQSTYVDQLREKLGTLATKSGKQVYDDYLALYKDLDTVTAELNGLRGNDAADKKAALRTKYHDTIQRFWMNFSGDALDEVQKTMDDLVAIQDNRIDFAQTQKNIANINTDFEDTQTKVLQDVYSGVKSGVEALQDLSKKYIDKMSDQLKQLNEELYRANFLKDDPQKINEIKSQIRALSTMLDGFVDDIVKQINDKLQSDLNLINANPFLTNGMKSYRSDNRQKEAYRELSEAYKQKAETLSDPTSKESILLKLKGKNPEYWAKYYEALAKYNAELGRVKPLMEEVEEAGRQGLENGLLNFFEEGYKSCHKLMDAVRDLAITILTEMNKVFAKDLTQRLMYKITGQQADNWNGSGWSLSDGKTLDPNFGFKGLFADGGSMDSGAIKGPGTGTSDSILAYLGNFKKFIGISDGEFVVKSAAVKKYGTNFLDNLNKGLIPNGFSNIKEKFASGGSLAGAKVSGVQDVAASLTNNNVTNIPLKIINLNDPNEIGKYLQSRSGEKVMINWIKNNATTVKHILK